MKQCRSYLIVFLISSLFFGGGTAVYAVESEVDPAAQGPGPVKNEGFTTTITYKNGTLEGPTGGIVPCSGVDCETCKFVELLNKVISFIILFMLVLIALLAAISGFKLVTSGGNQSQYSEAKSSQTNILIGIIIMLSSWLIIDTIMKAFLKNNGQVQWDESENGWGPWNQIQCTKITRGGDAKDALLPGNSTLGRVEVVTDPGSATGGTTGGDTTGGTNGGATNDGTTSEGGDTTGGGTTGEGTTAGNGSSGGGTETTETGGVSGGCSVDSQGPC